MAVADHMLSGWLPSINPLTNWIRKCGKAVAGARDRMAT